MKNLLIIIGLILSFPVFADASTDLSALLNATHTLKATFTQNITDNKGNSVQKAKGKMLLSRPGKFRWEITSPQPQTIIANGTKIWIYDPDLEQVTIRTLQKAGGTPALLLSNVNPVLKNDYAVSELPTKNNLRWFKLIPKDKDTAFDEVQIGFNNNQIQAMKFQDNLGHHTQITFQNVQSNVTLSDSAFNFKPPKGVDILDETRKG